MRDSDGISIEQVGVVAGALVEGLNLRLPISPTVAEQLRSALDRHHVLVIRGQTDLSVPQQLAVAAVFGVPGGAEPMRTLALLDGKEAPPGDRQVRGPGAKPYTDRFHTDISYAPRPPTVGTLSAKRMPKIGGDTAFVSLHAIYDALSEPMKQFCSALNAVHSINASKKDGFSVGSRIAHLFPDRVKPLVTTHSRTGRKALHIQAEKTWLVGLVDVSDTEADFILRYLRSHLDNIEFQFRWKWTDGDLLIWDQQAVAHMGMADHYVLDPYREVHSIWAYPDAEPQATDA